MTVGKSPLQVLVVFDDPPPPPQPPFAGWVARKGFLATHPLLCWGGSWETPTLATTRRVEGCVAGVPCNPPQHRRRWSWGLPSIHPAREKAGCTPHHRNHLRGVRGGLLKNPTTTCEGDCPYSHPLLFFFFFFFFFFFLRDS